MSSVTSASDPDGGAPSGLYLDTSAVLRSVLESGTTPAIEERIRSASVLVTSRLSLVESGRAILRLRARAEVAEERLADLEREIDEVWARCEIWELSATVCDLARQVAPRKLLRSLDALHLATYLLARRKLGSLELLTADDRLREAAGA